MLCDKCGREVPRDNDATFHAAIMTGDPLFSLMCVARHLLPVLEGDVKICEGSPSRAQYLEGQPRDERGSYPYRQEQEAPYRAAYAKMQEMEAKSAS